MAKTTKPKSPKQPAVDPNAEVIRNLDMRVSQLTAHMQNALQQQNNVMMGLSKTMQSILPGNVRMNALGMALELVKTQCNNGMHVTASDVIEAAKSFAAFLEPPQAGQVPAPMATPAAQA